LCLRGGSDKQFVLDGTKCQREADVSGLALGLT
jgi:hypothetical protein